MSVATIARLPRVRPVVELGVGNSRTTPAAVAVWDIDRWDNAAAKWSGLEPFWIDVTCNVHEIADLFVGRERSTETWEVGTAEVLLDNRTGWADYPRAVGAGETYLPVRPGILVRIGVVLDGATTNASAVWKFRGFVDAANPLFDPTLGETVQLLCIDAKGEAGRGELATVDPPVGANEFVHQRIARILDARSWPKDTGAPLDGPNGWRDLDVSGVQLVATELGQSAVDAIDRASDSAGGSVFGDIAGKVAYRNYGWQLFSSTAEPEFTIGNVQGPTYDGDGDLLDPGDICPTGWELSFARADFTNRVILQRTDMNASLIYDDAADIDLFGVESFELTDIETVNSTEMNNLAARILRARNFALAPRVAAVSLNAATAANVVDLLVAVDPRTPTRVLCRHRGGNNRAVINKVCLVTGMRHRITPSGWECRLSLDDASPWRVGAADGVWDVSEWDQADWAAPVPI